MGELLHEDMNLAQAVDAFDEFLTEHAAGLVHLRSARSAGGPDSQALLVGTPESVNPVWAWISAQASELGIDPRSLATDPTRQSRPSWARHLAPVDPHPPAQTWAVVDGFISYLAEVITAAVPGAHWRVGEHRMESYPPLNYPVIAAADYQNFLPGSRSTAPTSPPAAATR